MRYGLAWILVTALMVGCGSQKISTTETDANIPPVAQAIRTQVFTPTVHPTEPAISVQEPNRTPQPTETAAPTRTQSLLSVWRLNTDNQIAAVIEAEGPVVVNVQSAELVSENEIHYVRITATGIPDYTHHISQAEAQFLETRPRAATDFRQGHPLVGAGDTVDFGEDVGYSSTGCLNFPGTGYGFWPPGPTCPLPQHWEAWFPVDPAQATESTATGLGVIGLWVNGVAVFNWGDGQSWLNENTWRNLAPFAEIYDLDLCPGHSAFGTYHHHSHPTCLAVQLGDDGTAHSPIYGFAADGVPIAGPWADTDILARSSWKIRNYDDPTSPTGCGTAGVRSCLLINRYDPDAGTRPTDYPGPNTTAQVRTMSGNELTAFAGYYAEDWYFDAKLNDGITASLDAHNGHFGPLPSFSNPTYHYHVTRTVDPATPVGYREVFPFYIGPTFWGKIHNNALVVGEGGPPPLGEGRPPPPRPERPQPQSDLPSTPAPAPAAVSVAPQVLERYAAGQTLYKEGRLQAAIIEYDTALRLDPQFDAAHASRGQTYYALQQFERALHDYTEAIRVNPENATYYYARALTLTALTRDRQAQTDIAQAVALGSDRTELEARVNRLKYERHQACCSGD